LTDISNEATPNPKYVKKISDLYETAKVAVLYKQATSYQDCKITIIPMDSQAKDLLETLMNIDLYSHIDKIRELTRKSPKEEPKSLGTVVVKLTPPDGTVVDEMTLSIPKDAKYLEGFFGLVLLQKYQTRSPEQTITPPITIMGREDGVAKDKPANLNELPQESGPNSSNARLFVPQNHGSKQKKVVPKNEEALPAVSIKGNTTDGLKGTLNTPSPPRQK
jgi:hypothetical protein